MKAHETKNGFEFFVFIILPLIVLVIGILGNTIGFLVFLNIKVKEFKNRNIYIFLTISDTIFLLQIIFKYLEFSFKIHVTDASSLSCKIYSYFVCSLSPISPFLLINISIERLISITYPSKGFILCQTKVQFIFILSIIVFNLILYVPVPFFTDNVLSGNKTKCQYNNHIAQDILANIDLANLIIIPFVVMLMCTVLLILTLYRSRRRISSTRPIKEMKNFKKDLQFTISTISLNVIYLILNLPSLCLYILLFFRYDFSDSSVVSKLVLYLFYLGYAVNFYIILCTNSIVRKKFLKLFRLNKSLNSRVSNTLTTMNTIL